MSRHTIFTVLCLLLWSAHGAQVNITVDDADPSIVYAPSSSWNSSQVVCLSCNNPPVVLASQHTYHKGAHVIPQDTDDAAPASASAPKPPPSSTPATNSGQGKSPPNNQGADNAASTSAPPPPQSSTPTSTSGKGKSPSNDPDAGDGGKGGKDHDNDSDTDDNPNKRSHRRDDLDDPGFVDQPVFAQFNFTGTAVYIFCIQPLGLSTFPAPPTLMNVTFMLDDTPASTFIHQGSASASGFMPGVNAFTKTGLSDSPHVLKLNLAPNSVFILDSALITTNAPESSSASSQITPQSDLSPTPTPVSVQSQLSSPTSSAAADGTTTKKGRASFAGAVAGSLGVLGILCFGTAFSIYRRRRLAARRERLERGNAPPPMSGPAGSFIPRYFPGTVVSSTPPPYAAPSEPLLPQRTYADIPPDAEELVPPPFGVAITTPAVTLLPMSSMGSTSRPPSWAAVPHMVALPASIAPTSRTASLSSPSRTASLFSADDSD
ncbi:hypothetical protein C8R44DRAFT_896704 [Mycena epipterygia]|nr:hypothetical protein C8R44DRAFT_896704 [Mycena epipterygia]